MMCKNVLKFLTIGLLLLCVVIVPILGVSFYDSPGLIQENALFTNHQFGGGSAIYLTFEEDASQLLTEANLNLTAQILKERFLALGYSDTRTSVENNLVRVDLAQKAYIDSVISQAAIPGVWSVSGSSMNESLCDASMIEDVTLSTNASGYYQVSLKLTEEGAKKFAAKTASYSVTSAYIYLMLDGGLAAYSQLSSTSAKNSVNFQVGSYEDGARLVSIIKHGSLPANVVIEKIEETPATISGLSLTLVLVSLAILFAAACAVLLLKGRTAGIFAIFALIANIAVLLTAILNSIFMLNLATLITMVIGLVLSVVLSICSVTPVGKALKENKQISASALPKLGKINVKVIWIHAAIFAVTLIAWLLARGSFLYIVKAVMTLTCSNAICHFIFLYFSVCTLSEVQAQRTNKK